MPEIKPSNPSPKAPSLSIEDGGSTKMSSEDSEPSVLTRNVSHRHPVDATNMASFKLLLLILMVLQNSSTVLVARYSRSSLPKDQMYEFMQSVQVHILSRPLDALMIMVPALLYLVQNTLLYVALSNLTAPIFQVTYQCKLVTTAVVSVIMLQRKYNVRQWICLFGISVGVAIVVLGERRAEDEEKDKNKATNLRVGLVAVTIACMSSALAGVYFEKVLKANPASGGEKTPSASVWMRNMQLAFFSVVIAVCQGGMQTSDKPYFHGFNFWVWVLVALQSGGGLLVAAVIKYADNVLKGLATGVSVVLSSGLSMLIFATPLGPKFILGGFLILTSVWFFSNPVPEWLLSKVKSSNEMSSLLPN